MKRKAKILAVDDDPVNLAVIEEVLGEAYTLECLNSGTEALDKVRSFQPDLVLLDIMMPGMDGYEVCRQLRAHAGLRHLKIVLVSAKAMLNERLEGYRAGADDYITKPFNLLEFEAKVRVYMHLRSVEEVNHLKTAALEHLRSDGPTPLSAILAHAEVLAKPHSIPDAERCQLATTILEAARCLLKLGESAVMLGDMRLGQIHVPTAHTDVAAIVRALAAAIETKHRTRDVHISLQAPESLIADAAEGAVELIVDALLENAVHSSPRGGTIDVEVGERADWAHVAVTDRGPGLSESALEHLFATARARDPHRRGGALPLAKAMVEAMGGEIRVTSRPGNGSEFAVDVPLGQKRGDGTPDSAARAAA